MKWFSLFLVFVLIAGSAMALVTEVTDLAPAGKKPMQEIINPTAPVFTYSGTKAWYVQEDFELVAFPPTGWSLAGAANLWSRSTLCSGYGTGTASARADFYTISSGTQDLITITFVATTALDSLKFDHAYASYAGENDQLQISTSTDGGSIWSTLITLDGGASGPLATAPPQTASFIPTAGQWATKSYSIPVGTNAVRFTAITAYGNQLYIDNVGVGVSYTPVAHDMAVQSIDTPATLIVPPGVAFVPTVTIWNRGPGMESDFYTYYQIADSTGSIVYLDSVAIVSPDSIGGDSTRTLSFTQISPATLMRYNVAAYPMLAGDGHPENDTLLRMFRTYDLLHGTITDDNNGSALLAGVAVRATGPATYNTTTDGSGAYLFESMLDGSYTLTGTLAGYSVETVTGVDVNQAGSNTMSFSMGYPVVGFTPVDSIFITMPIDTTDTTTWQVTINNTGTRDLDYSLSWPVVSKGSRAFGDSLWGVMTETVVTDNQCLGVEVAAGYIWVTGGATNTDPNQLYQLDMTGALVGQYPQAAHATGWGWRDMCFDGTYLYASVNTNLDQIDPTTGTITGVTIPGPTNPCRGLAYNPNNDHFYTANFGSSIWEFDRTGTIINTWANTKAIYGLAFDGGNPAGPSLWVWSQDGTPPVQATRFDLTTGTYGTETFQGAVIATGSAGGATFTDQVVPGKFTLLGSIQDTPDRMVAYEIRDANALWMSCTPSSGTIAAAGAELVEVDFNTAGLTDLTNYSAMIHFGNNSQTPDPTLPVYLHTSPTGVSGEPVTNPVSFVFALNRSFPNPASGRAQFSYSLDKAGSARLSIYSVTGQLVRTLVNGTQSAGPHSVTWNGADNAGRKAASGTYVYRLTLDGRTATKRLVVVR